MTLDNDVLQFAGQPWFSGSRNYQSQYDRTVSAYIRWGSVTNLHFDASRLLPAIRQLPNVQKYVKDSRSGTGKFHELVKSVCFFPRLSFMWKITILKVISSKTGTRTNKKKKSAKKKNSSNSWKSSARYLEVMVTESNPCPRVQWHGHLWVYANVHKKIPALSRKPICLAVCNLDQRINEGQNPFLPTYLQLHIWAF